MFFIIGSFFGMLINRCSRFGNYDCFGENGVMRRRIYDFCFIFLSIFGINMGGGNVYVNIFV